MGQADSKSDLPQGHAEELSNAVHQMVGPSSSDMARVFAALSHPARIDILRHIARHRGCGCKDITEVLPLAQSTVSQHLKVLIEARLITVKTVPPRSFFQVNSELLQDVACTTSTFLDSCCDGSCC